MNKEERLEEIIKSHKGLFSNIEKYPKYDLQEGLPNIDLEIRTLSTITLYVLVDVNQSEDLLKDIAEARTALKEAAWQIRLSNDIRPIRKIMNFYNVDPANLIKYASELSKLPERQMLELPPVQLPIDMQAYSNSIPYARRM